MPFAPLLGAVRVVHGHADHGDGSVDARERPHAWDPPAGAHDHASVDLLPQDRVGAADVARPDGSDGRRLQAESRLSQCVGGVLDHLISGLSTPLERQVEVLSLDLETEHVRLEQAERFSEELLAGLVAVEHDHG